MSYEQISLKQIVFRKTVSSTNAFRTCGFITNLSLEQESFEQTFLVLQSLSANVLEQNYGKICAINYHTSPPHSIPI
jgi:hypothetical protein